MSSFKDPQQLRNQNLSERTGEVSVEKRSINRREKEKREKEEAEAAERAKQQAAQAAVLASGNQARKSREKSHNANVVSEFLEGYHDTP
ncbi:hypothetical protein N7541_000271 [Penicillium brevicompactum]|uniref:Uncharacterized protein n=1 Tax=Penicillium brevicompactum TaxID=5074 RepID=A0A9W9RVD3_PENBR|nr:hypothetical protein N7541_000271 [Penicillium brevicompactum]